MSKVLYEASPSLARANPFGTLLVALLILLGALLLVAGEPLLATAGIPSGGAQVSSIVGNLLIVTGVLRLSVWWIASKLDHLVIKEDEIVWTHGLLRKQYTEISMGSVRTVRVNQGLMQRIMNAGDVTVFTSGDIPEVVVKGLPNPGAIRDLIKSDL